MRYRTQNTLDDVSRDIASVVEFIGEKEYRDALVKIGNNLNHKGFVTPFDDAFFALELDLLNLERLRTQSSGKFTTLPQQAHAGVDFLLGLGQTISALSDTAKTVLLGRLRSGLDIGLWPLQHEMRIAANVSRRGWDIEFHDMEEGGGFDFLATKNKDKFEIESKAVSAYTGWPIKPDDLGKLLVEIKRHFVWSDPSLIPIVGISLESSLNSNREQLLKLVSAVSSSAQTKTTVTLPDAEVRFIGVTPDMPPEKLGLAGSLHAKMRRTIVLVNQDRPKVVLEINSKQPIRIERKIIQTVNEAARKQFSGSNPGIIWTHINFIDEDAFVKLGMKEDKGTPLLDGIANATLTSTKRDHLSQLVFSGGALLDRDESQGTGRSSYRAIIYDSPVCRFAQHPMFEGGRKHPSKR